MARQILFQAAERESLEALEERVHRLELAVATLTEAVRVLTRERDGLLAAPAQPAAS
jgi:chaperonin cofactor prefoldin